MDCDLLRARPSSQTEWLVCRRASTRAGACRQPYATSLTSAAVYGRRWRTQLQVRTRPVRQLDRMRANTISP